MTLEGLHVRDKVVISVVTTLRRNSTFRAKRELTGRIVALYGDPVEAATVQVGARVFYVKRIERTVPN